MGGRLTGWRPSNKRRQQQDTTGRANKRKWFADHHFAIPSSSTLHSHPSNLLLLLLLNPSNHSHSNLSLLSLAPPYSIPSFPFHLPLTPSHYIPSYSNTHSYPLPLHNPSPTTHLPLQVPSLNNISFPSHFSQDVSFPHRRCAIDNKFAEKLERAGTDQNEKK